MDERLVASQEAIDAFQRAADAAKRNARRLTAVLEREQSIGMGGAGRDLLEQRVGAANAAAAALQNRLSLLERAHERKAEALRQGLSNQRKPVTPSHGVASAGGTADAPSGMMGAVLAPVSLLMVPQWEGDVLAALNSRPSPSKIQGVAEILKIDGPPSPVTSPGGKGGGGGEEEGGTLDNPSPGKAKGPNWKPLPPNSDAPESVSHIAMGRRRGPVNLPTAIFEPKEEGKHERPGTAGSDASSRGGSGGLKEGRKRRGAMGDAELAAVRAANATSSAERSSFAKGGLMRQSSSGTLSKSPSMGGGLGLIGGGHGPECVCMNCGRRRQLLLWRDSMLDAQKRAPSRPMTAGHM